MYPEYANINGVDYKIDTDYHVALKCFEVVDDYTITDYERGLAIVYLLFDFIPKEEEVPLFLEKAKIYLQCGKTYEEQNNKKPDMDFIEDQSYIMSSFMSDYKIDLSKVNMHFWQYVDLIEGLTDNCSLNRIRDIRNFDLNKEKDSKRKEELKKAKKHYALKKKHGIEKEKEEKAKEIFNILKSIKEG